MATMTTTSTNIADINPEDLRATSVDVAPVERNWSEGYPDSWEFFEAVEIEDGPYAGVITDGTGAILDHDGEWIDPGMEVVKRIEERRGGPMMSSAYPLPYYDGDPARDARKIVHLPLCIVREESPYEGENYFLALTGGGMDLAWEIAEGYIQLGYLPPSRIASLPSIVGRGTSARDRAIVAACKRTADVMRIRAEYLASHLERLGQD